MKRNEYDYNKMMDDFELEARRKKIYNGIKNKWKAVSNAYNEKIEEMKLKNERLYMERDKKFKQKLKMKESSIKKQIELRDKMLKEKKKEQEEISKKRSDDIQKNLEIFYKKQEEKRLKLEKDTFSKCNYIFYNKILK